MDQFSVNETRMLYFHRVLIDQARRTPGLVRRASEALPTMRARAPTLPGVWETWQKLLAAGLDGIDAVVLADTAPAGLLRANSPLAEILDPDERNALWQRVGLQQFAAYYLAAVKDFGLSLDEEAAITGLSEDELAGWSDAPPLTMTETALAALKIVIAIHRALGSLFPDAEQRRAWLRQPSASFPAGPLAVVVAGDGLRVTEALAAALQPTLSRAAMPSH